MLYALHDRLKDDAKLRKVARTSDPQVFAESIFPKTFDEVAQDSYVEQTEAFTSLFQNKSKYKAIMPHWQVCCIANSTVENNYIEKRGVHT